MYTSFIGQKFLAAWNAKEKKALSAKEFFDEVMFPIFFDDERHLMHVHGSAFFQKVAEKDKLSGQSESEIRRQNLHTSVETKQPNGSIFVGYAADGTSATTSGQVSGLKLNITKDEIYSSWIGAALAMGVNGGICFLADKEDILFKIFEGWEWYRKFLTQTPNLKGRQIETWNGQWISHRLNNDTPASFRPIFEEKTDVSTKQKYWAVNTLEWAKLIFAFSKIYPNTQITVYSYNLSQTNTTLGFLNINLPEVSRFYQLKDKIFFDSKDSILTHHDIQSLEPYFSIKQAALSGAIGLRSLEPKKLREYLPQKDPKKNKYPNFVKEDSKIQFQIFKLWIYAMLNKTELLDLAGQVAALLLQFEEAGKDRGKKVNDQLSEEIRSATSLRLFIDKLSEVLTIFPSANETFRKVVDNAVKMPSDHFPLFVTLIRFEYASQKNHQSK